MRRVIAIAITASVFGALSGVVGYQKTRPLTVGGDARDWQEVAWPYPRDGWPVGRAFRCDGCAEPIELYVRPKIGFCNSDSGVADDDEVDRVADLDLISQRFAPLEPGRVIRVADMPGRVRTYDLAMPDGSRRTAVGIAVSRRSDLLVAVAQGKGTASQVQRAALDYLASPDIAHWMVAAMEGK
ncbi:hypothetical protein ABID59_000153 [Bradyrhizobium sp. S3.3.6]|uniref:hypothetical protein n=1 Tax=Bradyrhizobium sp. S3.3.6 TaxID=3156429 RepID=UPI003390EA74